MNDRTTRWDVASAIIIVLAVLLTLVMLLGMDDSCKSGFALADIRARKVASCGEFWLNRYQTLLTGILSASIATGAAILVLKQLREMNRQNTVAERAMKIASDQLAAESRREISQAIDAALKARAHIYGMAISLESVEGQTPDVAKKTYNEGLGEFIPELLTLRRTMDNIDSTPEVQKAYDEFEVNFRAASAFFGKAHYENLKNLAPGAYDISEARSIIEAKDRLFDAVRALNSLQNALRAMRLALSKWIERTHAATSSNLPT